MATAVVSLLGSKIGGFSVVQDFDDEIVLTLDFVCDDGETRTIQFSADKDQLHNPGRQYDTETKEWKDIP